MSPWQRSDSASTRVGSASSATAWRLRRRCSPRPRSCARCRSARRGASKASSACRAALIGLPVAFLLMAGEELVFRGYGFRQLIAACGARTALAASALAFGVYHLAQTGFGMWGIGAFWGCCASSACRLRVRPRHDPNGWAGPATGTASRRELDSGQRAATWADRRAAVGALHRVTDDNAGTGTLVARFAAACSLSVRHDDYGNSRGSLGLVDEGESIGRRTSAGSGQLRRDSECDFDGPDSSWCASWWQRLPRHRSARLHYRTRLFAWLQSYIRVDTINPPGNETAGVQFFKAILDAEGIPYDTAESAPGRGNIWARLKGGDQPALMLLHHMDVVPANKASWQQRSPFRRDQGWICLRPRCARHEVERDPAPGGIRCAPPIEDALNRDVIFMATADEEAGGFFGVGWLVKNRPGAVQGCWVCDQRRRRGPGSGRADAVRHRSHAKSSVLVAPHSTRRTGSRIHASSVLGRDDADCGTRKATPAPVRAAHCSRGGRLFQGHRAGRAASLARALREYLDRYPHTRRGRGAPARRPGAAHAGPEHLLHHAPWRQRQDQCRAA